MLCQIAGRLVRRRATPLTNSGSLANPFIRRVDHALQISIGDDVSWQVAAGSGNP